MYLYLIFGAMAFFAYFEQNLGRRFGKTILLPFTLLFFCLSFLRWERGTDWKMYLMIFKNITHSKYLQENFEYLFKMLNTFIYDISGSFTLLLFVEAVIIYCCYYFVIKKYSVFPILSLLVWLSIALGNIFFTRQAIAIAICFFSVIFIIERRKYWFVALILIACLFHRTAVIFLPAYWLYYLNFTRKQIFVVLAISIVSTVIASSFLTFLADADWGVFSHKSEVYLTGGLEKSAGSSYTPIQTLIRGGIYRLGLLLIFIRFFFEQYRKNVFLRGLVNLYLANIFLFAIFAPISSVLVRFASYYDIFQVLLFPMLLAMYKDGGRRQLILLLILIYLAFRFNSVIVAYEELYIPYKSIFNKELPVKVW